MATQDEPPRRTSGRRKPRTSGTGRTGARFPALPPEPDPEETGAHARPVEDDRSREHGWAVDVDRGTGSRFGSEPRHSDESTAATDFSWGSGGHMRSLPPTSGERGEKDRYSSPPEEGGQFGGGSFSQGEYGQLEGRVDVPDGDGSSPPADIDGQAVVGGTGARYGPYSVGKAKRTKRSEDSAPARPAPSPSAAASSFSEPARAVRWPDEAFNELAEQVVKPWSSALVRPYAHTGGRTRADCDLALEALISTSVEADVGPLPVTAHGRAIVELCLRPRSVAEVAALLAVPLGVARVLLSDLATAGVVFVHPTGGGRVPEVDFMHRVLVGLRRL